MIVSLQEIDDYIVQAKERSYETMVNFGKQGLSIAATAAVSAAVKASFFLFLFFVFLFLFWLAVYCTSLTHQFCSKTL